MGGHPSILGKSENLQFFGSGPGLMSMDSICMLLRHGICCMNMVYALGRWDMLYGHGKCLVVGKEYLCCIYSTCTVHTVHVLYIQYMYCMYSTCTVCTAQTKIHQKSKMKKIYKKKTKLIIT